MSSTKIEEETLIFMHLFSFISISIYFYLLLVVEVLELQKETDREAQAINLFTVGMVHKKKRKRSTIPILK